MTRKVIVFTCAHADPTLANDRFTALGKFIYDQKPDMVIDLGDMGEFGSLSSYEDRYPERLVTQNYEKDVLIYNDAQERLRWKFRKQKRKRPFWVGFMGNHEYRINLALQKEPRLAGEEYGISVRHLQTDHWYDEYHQYCNSAPSIADYDRISYAHYFSLNNRGRAISGLNHANNLVTNRGHSSTCGHSHFLDYKRKSTTYPKATHGLVCGNFKGKEEHWAGQAQRGWWAGVVVKHNVCDGDYDPEFISYDRIMKEYGK